MFTIKAKKIALVVGAFLAVCLGATPLFGQSKCPGCSEPAKVVHPNGFGPQSYARWQANTGLSDSNPKSAFSMLMVHLTPATIITTARAVVAIEGFDGEPVGLNGVSGLEFYVRTKDPSGTPTPNECSATSPRFSIRWRDSISNAEGFAELHCGNPGEMPPVGLPQTAPNGSTYQKHTVNQTVMFLAVPPTARIISLAILWDDSGSSHIDNISVTDATVGCTPCTWTGPADNGSN